MYTKGKMALWQGLFALLIAFFASAGSKAAVLEKVEVSMLLKGSLVIETDGTVSEVTFKEKQDLSDSVANFVRDTATSWRFEPIMLNGKVVRARAPMTLRLVGEKLKNNNYEIRIRSASFVGNNPGGHPDSLNSINMKPPKYPLAAIRSGLTGSVYLLLKVGRDGKVEQAHAEQVNLQFLASETVMRNWRKKFAEASLQAAAEWTFQPPTEGEQASKPYWMIRAPVTFSFIDRSSEGDVGKWVSYVPGPRERAPWDTQDEVNGFSPDALPDGGVYLAEQTGPRLLTPLQDS